MKTETKIKYWLIFFIVALILSGLTAFPLETELAILNDWTVTYLEKTNPIREWIGTIYQSLHDTNAKYPFLAYGTDWLAFAHIIIAIFFIGVYKDPIKNIWIIQAGQIACLLVIPLAFIAGTIREIPIFWRIIDCSFGVIGIIPLLIVEKYIKRLVNRN